MDMINIQGGGDSYESAQAEVGLEGVDDESGSNSSGEDDQRVATAPPAWQNQDGGHQSLLKVLQAFQMLKMNFDAKFKAMWA